MMETLRLWFNGLSGRERLLIAIAGVLAVLTALTGIAIALSANLDSAHTRYVDSIDRLGGTKARVAALADLQRNAPPAPSGGMEALLRAQATERGLIISSLTAQPDGSTELTVAQARPSAILQWVSQLEQSGLVVLRLAVRDNGNQSVSVELRAKPRSAS